METLKVERLKVHSRAIARAAQQAGVPATLLAAIAWQESGVEPFHVQAAAVRCALCASMRDGAIGRSPRGDLWARYHEFALARWGIVGVEFLRAVDANTGIVSPAQLCDVTVGLHAGAQVLATMIRTSGSEAAALRLYSRTDTDHYAASVAETRAVIEMLGTMEEGA